MSKYKVKVSGITCSNCAQTIKNGLSQYDVSVNINTSEVIIHGSNLNPPQINRELKLIGYPPQIKSDYLKLKLIISISATIPLVLAMFNHFPLTQSWIPDLFSNHYLQLILASIVQFYAGGKFYRGALNSLRQKVLGMDLLVVISTTTAFFYSLYMMFFSTADMPSLYFETSSLIITIVLAGNYIEHLIKQKSNAATIGLINLKSDTAHLLDGTTVQVSDLTLNDQIIVFANEKIPVDGEILEGKTYVDESSFTGESKPVLRRQGSKVIGGSNNLSHQVTIKVTKIGQSMLINQIIDAVEEASLTETKYQRIADKIAGYFVPFVLIIALITYILNLIITQNSETAILNAMSVLLISCPCALGLATPTAIIVASGVSSKRGLLYRGGNFFEEAYKVDVICFDKTGTLTKGEPQIINYQIDSKYNDIIYTMTKQSNHPVSQATAKYLSGKDLKIKVNHLPGVGLKAIYQNHEYVIASYKYNQMLKQQAETTNYFLIDGQKVGSYQLDDEIKETAKTLINRLTKARITPIMITGDNPKVASKIAQKLSINEYYADVLPIEKANIVKDLQKKHTVAFVGDGVNDSVALTQADIGITVQKSNDIAASASDVILLSDNLNLILDGIKISQKTRQNIIQNLLWAFSYNLIAIPLAATGNLNMYLAAAAMAFSSIVVLLNAQRLNTIKFSKI